MAAYKFVSHKSTIESVSDAYSMLESLRDECQEIVDNAPDNLKQTGRIQTFEETVSALDDCDRQPDVPEALTDAPITYGEAVNKNKKRGPSRATQRDNAVAIIDGCIDAAQGYLELAESTDKEELPEAMSDEQAAESKERAQNNIDEVQAFIDELENTKGNVEGAEFPGMFG